MIHINKYLDNTGVYYPMKKHGFSYKRLRSGDASSIIGAAIALAILFTAVIPLLIFIQNMQLRIIETGREFILEQIEKGVEELAVRVYVNSTTNTLWISVTNIGDTESSLKLVVLSNQTNITTPYIIVNATNSTEFRLAPGDSLAIDSNISPVVGNVYVAYVTTFLGNVFVSRPLIYTGAPQFSYYINVLLANVSGGAQYRLEITGPENIVREFFIPFGIGTFVVVVGLNTEGNYTASLYKGATLLGSANFVIPDDTVVVIDAGEQIIGQVVQVDLLPQLFKNGTVAVKGYIYSGSNLTASSITTNLGFPQGSLSDIAADDNTYYRIESQQIPGVPPSNWLSPNWRYRIGVNITNNMAVNLNAYQVKIVIDSTTTPSTVLNHFFTNSRSDGTDIRVTLSDGVTLTRYWIQEWDPSAQRAIIWIRINLPASSTVTVYIYYGNPGSTSHPSGIYGLTKIMQPLPANDGSGYTIQYEVWIMPENRFQNVLTNPISFWWPDAEDGIAPVSYSVSASGFPYYSSTYTNLVVATNGFICMRWNSIFECLDSTSSESQFKNLRGFIAPFWADLDLRGAGRNVYRDTITDEFGDALYLRWRARYYNLNGNVNFGVALYSNGLIRFDYSTITGTGTVDDTPIVGVSFRDGTHYTVVYGDGTPGSTLNNHNSIMLWPRKKANVEPTVSVGSTIESQQKYVTEAVVSYSFSSSIGGYLYIQVMSNVSGINLYVEALKGGLWESLHSATINVANSEVSYIITIPATYVSGGSLSIRIVTEYVSNPYMVMYDYILFESYAPVSPAIYIGAGGTSDVVIYDLDTESIVSVMNLGFIGSNIFDGTSSIAFDHDRGILWVYSGSSIYGVWLVDPSTPFTSSAPAAGLGSILAYVSPGYLLLARGGGSSILDLYDVQDPWVSISAVSNTNIGVPVDDYSSSAVSGSSVYIAVGGGNIDFISVSVPSLSVQALNTSPTAYTVGMAYDSSNNRIWVMSKGGGIYYYDISTDSWYTLAITIPYYPIGSGDRLVYSSGVLYHIRADSTKDLLKIVVS